MHADNIPDQKVPRVLVRRDELRKVEHDLLGRVQPVVPLLALSSMVTRDIYCRYWRPKASLTEQVRVGKVVVCALAAGGLAIALHPPEAILSLATQPKIILATVVLPEPLSPAIP